MKRGAETWRPPLGGPNENPARQLGGSRRFQGCSSRLLDVTPVPYPCMPLCHYHWARLLPMIISTSTRPLVLSNIWVNTFSPDIRRLARGPPSARNSRSEPSWRRSSSAIATDFMREVGPLEARRAACIPLSTIDYARMPCRRGTVSPTPPGRSPLGTSSKCSAP
jgi:hypothetical protein